MQFEEVIAESNFLVKQPVWSVMGNEERLKLVQPVMEVDKYGNVYKLFSELWNNLDHVISVMEPESVS